MRCLLWVSLEKWSRYTESARDLLFFVGDAEHRYRRFAHAHITTHYSDVTSASLCLTSTATRLFAKQLVLANRKGNLKATHYWPFVRGTAVDSSNSDAERVFLVFRHHDFRELSLSQRRIPSVGHWNAQRLVLVKSKVSMRHSLIILDTA